MRILLISYFYEPYNNARAFRWTALAKSFIECGHTVDVVTHKGSINNKSIKIIEGLSIFHTKSTLIDKFSNKPLNQINSKQQHIRSTFIVRISSFFLKFAKCAYRRIIKTLLWPDSSCLWIIKAKAIIRKLTSEHQYDLIISVSHPYSSHVVGYQAYKLSRSSRWLLDVGDPYYAFNPIKITATFFRALNRYHEKYLYEKSDAICVTTNNLATAYRKFYPELADKFHCIAPLISLPTQVFNCHQQHLHSTKRSLVFAGTLYRLLRSPKPLLALFENLLALNNSHQYELHFYGNIHDCSEIFASKHQLLRKQLFIHGMCPKQEVVSALEQADILINIGNESAYQIPSKVIEYMYLGKPIINLVSSQDDLSLQLLASYPLAKNINIGDPDEIDIKDIVEFIQSESKLTDQQLEPLVRPYLINNISNCYLKLIHLSPVKSSLPAQSQPFQKS